MTAEMSRLTGRSDLDATSLAELVHRVELRSSDTHLVINAASCFPGEHLELALSAVRRRLEEGEEAVIEMGGSRLRIVLNRRLQLRGGRTVVTGGNLHRSAANPNIITALRRAHADLKALNASPLSAADAHQHAIAPATQYERQLSRLAFLAPDLQRRLLLGEHSPRLNPRALIKSEIPLAWADQAAWFDSLV